jgi:mRNA interferase RelE/StbE
MAWRIEYDSGAVRDLSKLDKQIARRIIKFLGQRVAKLDDPRSIGAALRGSKLGDFWKYRVGDCRIIAAIEEKFIGRPTHKVEARGLQAVAKTATA